MARRYSIRYALRRPPSAVAAHVKLHALDEGMAHLRAGRWNEGVECLQRALAERPDFAEVWSNLGYGLRELGRLDEAREALERAVGLRPDLAEAWNLLGLIAQARQRHESAREHFTRAIDIAPRFAIAWMNRAKSDYEMGHPQHALEGYARSLALDPRHPDTHVNIGYVHYMEGNAEAAVDHFRQALRLRPEYARAHLGLAHALRLSGQSGWMEHYQDAVRISPESVTAHQRLSNALFVEGRFEEAWREYRWRQPRLDYVEALKRGGLAYRLPRREELRGRRVAIVGEQGLGDNIFFLRYAALLRTQDTTLEYVGDARLHPLLARTGVFDSFAERAPSRNPPADFAILAGDLALLFPDIAVADALPRPLALTPDPRGLEVARQRLRAAGPPPYVALTWRAGEPKTGERRYVKQIEPSELGRALRGVAATWIAVQRRPRDGDLATLAESIDAPVHGWGDVNDDLDFALATMAAVDHYVGVSNTNMHLRAGVSREAHVLVAFPPEWRWMGSGDSPWFPGFRIYREDRTQGWRAALEGLRADLRA